jgi:hypothetical protein
LVTDYWRDGVFRGQSHFIFPFIIALILFLSTKSVRYHFFYTGLAISLLIWIRPNAMLMVPFMFLWKETKRAHFLTGLVTGALFFTGTTFFAHQQFFWIDFYASCKEWVKINYSDYELVRCHINIKPERMTLHRPPDNFFWRSQMVNVFEIFKRKLNINVKLIYLNGLFVVFYLTGLISLYKKPLRSFEDVVLAGIFFYWLSEIASPYMKMSYYYIELFVVVIFLAGKFHLFTMYSKFLFVSIAILPFLYFIPMNLALAEYCLMFFLLYYLTQKTGRHGDKSPMAA